MSPLDILALVIVAPSLGLILLALLLAPKTRRRPPLMRLTGRTHPPGCTCAACQSWLRNFGGRQ